MAGEEHGGRGVHPRGFATAVGREAKARKILAILEESGALGETPRLVLDIGTGSGEIAAFLGGRHRVVSVDVVDQRTVRGAYRFVVGAAPLPFRDGLFDVAISNHVIEHVPDRTAHLAEIARVLRPGGVCYLATPNRLWPREPHHRVWLIHWLPLAWSEGLLRRAGQFRERVRLLSWRGLVRRAVPPFALEVAGDRVLRRPGRYFLRVPSPIGALLGAVPAGVYRFLVALHPTFIVLLRKPAKGGAPSEGRKCL